METIYLEATASGLQPICTSPIAVDHNIANKITILTQPSSTAIAGTSFATQPAYNIRDVYNNLVDDGAHTISLEAHTNIGCTASSGGPFNQTPKASSSGSATFSGTNHEKMESIYLKAGAPGLTSICSNAIIVSHSLASQLILTQQPSSATTAGVNFALQPIISIVDNFNNIAISSTDTISLSAWTSSDCTSTPSSGNFNSTNTAAFLGTALFSNVNHEKMETIYLKAAAPGFPFVCSNSINVNHNVPTQALFTVQPVANETIDKAFEIQPVLEIFDAHNNLTTSNNTSSLTLLAFNDSSCTITSGFNLNNNTFIATNGKITTNNINASSSNLTLYLKADFGSFSVCSNQTSVYPDLSAVYTSSQNTLSNHTIEINGGVPPLNCGAYTLNESGSTKSSCYTAGCSSDLCIDYTAGAQGNSSSDSFNIIDNAFDTNEVSINFNVVGPYYDLNSGNGAFGYSAIDVTQTITIINPGLNSTAISSSITGSDASLFQIGANDDCTSFNLDQTNTCDIDIDFLGSSAPSSSNFDAILTLEGSNGGLVTIPLTANK